MYQCPECGDDIEIYSADTLEFEDEANGSILTMREFKHRCRCTEATTQIDTELINCLEYDYWDDISETHRLAAEEAI